MNRWHYIIVFPKAEAQTKIEAVIEDIERLERKLQADPEEDWTHASDIEIECNMKEIKDWERELSSIRKEAREVVRLVNGNNLTDLQEGTRKLVQTSSVLWKTS